MKNIIISLIVSISFLNAKTIIATYKVGFGIFGKIGTAKAVFKIKKDNTYHISIKAAAIGLAKVLSGGRVESYESEGKVINGFLVPDIYKGITQNHSKISTKIYYFLHKKRVIDMLKIRVKDGKESRSNEKLKYYAKNDILTLFFNIKHYLDNFKFKGTKNLYAVGANKKDGKVNIIAPAGKQLSQLKSYLKKKKGHFLIVFVNQKIFASKRGELYLDINDDGVCTKAVLKDVVLFGDIRGELVDLKYE